jgi:hypothetical protein
VDYVAACSIWISRDWGPAWLQRRDVLVTGIVFDCLPLESELSAGIALKGSLEVRCAHELCAQGAGFNGLRLLSLFRAVLVLNIVVVGVRGVSPLQSSTPRRVGVEGALLERGADTNHLEEVPDRRVI